MCGPFSACLPLERVFPAHARKSVQTGVKPRVRFLERSHIIWISHYQKTEDPKKRSFTMTTACPGAPRDDENRGKKRQTDPRSKDKKEKQHEHMNMQNVYISV